MSANTSASSRFRCFPFRGIEERGRLGARTGFFARRMYCIHRKGEGPHFKQPSGSNDGLSLLPYGVGEVYEVTVNIGDYLVVEGFAEVEMRQSERQPNPTIQRRKPSGDT